MGIKNFSKVFTPNIIKFKDIENKKIAVDAYLLLYQSALGSSSVNLLTDPNGNPTIHINVIIGKCLNFIKNKNECCWVFDYHEKDYIPPDKIYELNIRKKKKDIASEKLKLLKADKDRIKEKKNKNYDELFSSDEEIEYDEPDDKDIQRKINQKEKEVFSMNDIIINDCKFILECLNIKYTTAPKDVEAEAVCSKLTYNGYDITWSCDTDSILYGSRILVREIKSKGKKVLQQYILDDLLNYNNLDIDDLKKIGIVLGSDHAPKTPGIGPGTVLKKYKSVKLTEVQDKAIQVFSREVDLSNLKFHGYEDNITKKEYTDKINKLIDWLVIEKGFNREKIKNRIDKAIK